MITKGAQCSIVDKENGKSALHEALSNKHVEIATILVDKGKINMTIKDREMGETALHLAIRSITTTQDILLCSHLLDKADINVLNMQDKNGNTLLHIAVIRSLAPKSSTALVETIIAYKIDPTIKNNINKTALDIISTSENTKLIDMVRRYTLSFMASLSPPPSPNTKSNPIIPTKPIIQNNNNIQDESSLVDKRFKQLNIAPQDIDCPVSSDQLDSDWKLVQNLHKHIEKLLNDDWEVTVEFGVLNIRKYVCLL